MGYLSRTIPGFARLGLAVTTWLGVASLVCAVDGDGADSGQRGGKIDSPNIVLIVADDLGYGELGCYGQSKIRTPRLDQLAAEGMRFTDFYAGNNVCAPSRCCLMTGLHSGHAYIRDNGNPPDWKANAESHGWVFPGQNPIPEATQTLPGLLAKNGYVCGGMGKWGLGHVGTSGDPSLHGFDLFYGYYCQVHAHNHYPKFLWRNQEKEFFEGNRREATGEVYSQDRFIDVAVEFLESNHQQPFFLYLPFAVPHLSVQVPDEELAAYDGIIEEEAYQHRGYIEHPRPRAGYAAMVSRMDTGIGKILDTLEQLGVAENTIVLFTSDNGPTYDRLGGSDSDYFHSSGGFRGRKGSMYEGGIRVPLIVRWPDRVAEGSLSHRPSAFWDLLPTLVEAAGGEMSQPVDGLSLLPEFQGNESPEHDFLYWESTGYRGQQAVRFGNYKAVRQGLLPKGRRNEPLVTEIYDLATDPSESQDLSKKHPELVTRAEEIFTSQHVPSTLAPLPILDNVSN